MKQHGHSRRQEDHIADEKKTTNAMKAIAQITEQKLSDNGDHCTARQDDPLLHQRVADRRHKRDHLCVDSGQRYEDEKIDDDIKHAGPGIQSIPPSVSMTPFL